MLPAAAGQSSPLRADGGDMLTWWRCPTRLAGHPRLLGVGGDVCWMFVALSGWRIAKGEPLSDSDLSPRRLSLVTQMPAKWCQRILGKLRQLQLLVPDSSGGWLVVDLVEYSGSAERMRKHRDQAATRDNTPASHVPSQAASHVPSPPPGARDQTQTRHRPDTEKSEEEASARDGAGAREEAGRPTGSTDPTDRPGLQAVEYSDDECMAIAVRTADYAAELFGLPGTASQRALSAIAGCARAGLSEEALQDVAYAFRWAAWYQKDSPRVRPAALETMYDRGVEKARSWSAEGRALRAQHEATERATRDADDRRRALKAEDEAQIAEARAAAVAGDAEAARWLIYHGIPLDAEADGSQTTESVAARAVG